MFEKLSLLLNSLFRKKALNDDCVVSAFFENIPDLIGAECEGKYGESKNGYC